MRILMMFAVCAGAAAAQGAVGFEVLFDGKSTDGWRGFRKDGFPDRGWVVEDGCLKVQAGGGGGDIVTRKTYGDFDFRFEWKVAPGANSGIMYRVGEDQAYPWNTGPEFQVLDDGAHPDGKDPRTAVGALYGLKAAEGKTVRPPGEFNEGRILCRGSRLEHWVNGVRVVSVDLQSADYLKALAASKFASMPRFGRRDDGHICLQDHGNDVWFRGLRILDLSGRTDVALFDGATLNGWSGFTKSGELWTDTWRVQEQILVCGGKPPGYIQTLTTHADFLLTVEWRWPEGGTPGNSGILFRKSGEDRVWPRSIEAQLMHENAGDFYNIGGVRMGTDPDRTAGSRVKKTGPSAERPVGEWNTYEVLCLGGEVELSVNGKRLNRAWDCEVLSGPILLQSEGAEIHFRQVSLIPLDR